MHVKYVVHYSSVYGTWNIDSLRVKYSFFFCRPIFRIHLEFIIENQNKWIFKVKIKIRQKPLKYFKVSNFDFIFSK